MLLSVSHLQKSYPVAHGELVVLRDVNLELDSGDGVAIVGPSGSGKSTLLSILGTLEPPTGGAIRLDGADPFALSPLESARFRNRTIGFVFQDHHLLPQCSAIENVLIPTLVATDGGSQRTRAETLLDRVGLAARSDHRPAELSGGERQRVALARALINQPRLVLADEPTGSLDAESAQGVTNLLLELCQEGRAGLIVITHNAELAARLPRRAVLRDGSLTQDAPQTAAR